MSPPRRYDIGSECLLRCGKRVTSGSRTGVCGWCYDLIKQELGQPRVSREQIIAYVEQISEFTENNIIKTSTKENYEREVQVFRGNWVVCSDVHVPRHNPSACAAVSYVGRQYEIDQLLIAGDIADNDGISRHRKRIDADGVLETYRATFLLLREWARTFRRIHILKGNHDDRLQRLIESATEGRGPLQKLVSSLSFESPAEYRVQFREVIEQLVLKLLPELQKKVTWDIHPQCFIEGPAGQPPFRVVHPAIYSRHAPQAEKRLSIKYTQPVLGTHGHLVGLGFAPNGLYPVAQIGHMTDPVKHLYLAEQLTDHPEWNTGFASIVNGKLRLWADNPYLEGEEVFRKGGA